MKLERTRASEERPAMAMPMCVSISMTFFWYEESSSAFRWTALALLFLCFDGEDDDGIPSIPREQHVSC